MTREKAIEVLENGAWWDLLIPITTIEGRKSDIEVHEALDIAIAALRNGWISVEDRLPEEFEVVLCIVDVYKRQNDPLLKGRFALNEFANRAEVFGPLPWSKDSGRRQWDDNDNYGLYWYMEKRYRLTSSSKVDGALSLHSRKHSFNEVVEYLQKLKWDGVPRLDTLLIDYLGAADSEYTRAVTRKSFTAAVARAMEPGCKYDQMTVISGPQLSLIHI